MGNTRGKGVGIEGEPPQRPGGLEPRPAGGRHCPAWEDEIRLENREEAQGVEGGGE